MEAEKQNKKKVPSKKQEIGIHMQTLAAITFYQNYTQNLHLDLSMKILDSLTIGWLH